MLVEFAEQHKFRITNTFFNKLPDRRWTWISPNGATKNKIDYITTDRTDTFPDVSVINSLNTGSDHHLIRGKARIDTRFERARMVAQPKKVRTGKLQHHRGEFQVQILNRLAALASIPQNDLDSSGDTTVKTTHEGAISIAGRYKSEKPDKLSTGTKQLREKRRQRKRNDIPTHIIEYSEICKAIQRKMNEDIRKHDEKQITQAIENSKIMKLVRQEQRLGKGQCISIMEKDGTHIYDKDRIVKTCVKFYKELHRSRRASAD